MDKDAICVTSDAVLLDQYELMEPIGAGNYGDVIKARHRSSNTVIAIKRLQRTGASAAVTDIVSLAVRHVANVTRHVNLACWYDTFQFSASQHAMVMELFDMNLAQFMACANSREINPRFQVSLQCVRGLAFLHSQQPLPMTHRNVTPQNVLIKIHPETNTVVVAKLADFGIVDVIEANVDESTVDDETNDDVNSFKRVTVYQLNPSFKAPEIFAAKHNRGLAKCRLHKNAPVDIFALGVVYLYTFCHNTSKYGKLFLDFYHIKIST